MSNSQHLPSAAGAAELSGGLLRNEWFAASRFHPLTDAEVLREVYRRIQTQNRPVLLLDLDSTLYEVGTRTHQILREWVAAAESHAFPSVRPVIERLERQHVGYSLRDTFTAVGLELHTAEVQKAWESAKKFWMDRFFTSDYLAYDLAYEGAAEFVREAYRLGAEIVYLTGRDEPGMGDGTRKRLLEDGFPWQVERTHLLLKKAFELDDLEHKQAAATYVRERGNLVASFENEPPNLVALRDIFPEAMHVFMDTVCSDRPAEPREGLYRIARFER